MVWFNGRLVADLEGKTGPLLVGSTVTTETKILLVRTANSSINPFNDDFTDIPK